MEGMYGSASGMQQPLVVPPLSNRVSAPAVAQQPMYQQDGAVMRKIETGGGSYQQQELGMPMQAPTAYGSAQPTTAASAADLNRGIRHAGAFIPPRPVDPESTRSFGASTPQQRQMPSSPFEDDSAFAQDLSARPAGLQLNPPVPGQRSANKKPSLFDKISSMFTEGDDDAGDDSQGGNTGSGGGLFSGFTARRHTSTTAMSAPLMPEPQVHHQQPAAPMVQPQTQQQGQDLEIPAFLRRQVS
jgi:hypothetical protein